MNSDPTSLDLLHDLVTPAPVSWWPPTPGWSIVLAALALAALALAVKALIHWQRNRYRREALHLLEDPATTPAQWSALLKRTALAAWPREEVAHLTGGAWLDFLDRTGGTRAFSEGAGRSIEDLAFDPQAGGSADELKALVGGWIRNHRREQA